MANIKIMVNGPLMDGHRVTFKAPCDCNEFERLKVYFPSSDGTLGHRFFELMDAHGQILEGIGNFHDAFFAHTVHQKIGLRIQHKYKTSFQMVQKMSLLSKP